MEISTAEIEKPSRYGPRLWKNSSLSYLASYVTEVRIFSLDELVFRFWRSFAQVHTAYVWTILLEKSDVLLRDCPLHIKSNRASWNQAAYQRGELLLSNLHHIPAVSVVLCVTQEKFRVFERFFHVWVAWKIRTNGNPFPVWRRRPFGPTLAASVNNRLSSRLWWCPNDFNTLSTSLQEDICPVEKRGKRYF